MTLLGKEIILKGITQKGKNCVRDHGDRWIVLAETDFIVFSPSKVGKWLFVALPGCGQNDKSSRWIHAETDHDFCIVVKN